MYLTAAWGRERRTSKVSFQKYTKQKFGSRSSRVLGILPNGVFLILTFYYIIINGWDYDMSFIY